MSGASAFGELEPSDRRDWTAIGSTQPFGDDPR
jgi:hypothetical protein